MKNAPPPNQKLYWREILSADDIRKWALERKMPKHLRGTLTYPGVYRFVLPEFADENGRHIPCYVGEAGRIGRRFYTHFRWDDKERRDKNGKIILKDGWGLRGSVQNSRGEFSLQLLTIDGALDFCGVVLNAHSFDDPFERRLLENWAIRSSEQNDRFRLLNRGVSQSTKNFFELIKAARRKHKRSTV